MYRRIIHHRYKKKRYRILFLILAALLTAVWFAGRFTYDYFIRRSSYDKIVANAAKRHCVDSLLLKAVIWRESGFNQNARGSKNEIGLMQIRRDTAAADWAKAYDVDLPCEGMLFLPDMNIEIGAWYLSRAVKKWKRYDHCEALALSEYNAGPEGMKRWAPSNFDGNVIDNITITSTRHYVSSVMAKYLEYSSKRSAEE